MSSGFATGGGTPLGRAFDTPEAKRRYVKSLFTTIAGRYDLITRLLSFGRDQRWKAALIARAGIMPGERVLDLACGTGDLAFAAARCGANVLGVDLTHTMIERARVRAGKETGGERVIWIVADMTHLPVQAASCDVVTTGYGLRNVPDLTVALAEIHRVLRPGGRLYSLDFDRPEAAWLRRIYLFYLDVIGASLGFMLHRNPDTYRYIPASIRRYPGAKGVARMMTVAGFTDAQHIPVLGGLMAIHDARR
jgi:demethylmenaquinone methyltransferase/2-methoxy-6-polyprenyl-1,4-benzoquinol methylase